MIRVPEQGQLEEGDQVLVLLPTSTHKLLSKWQGPHPILHRLSPTNYEINMFDKRKKRIFRVNMLKKWHAPETSCLAEEVLQEELPTWDGDLEEVDNHPTIGEQLDNGQRVQLETMLRGYPDVLSQDELTWWST